MAGAGIEKKIERSEIHNWALARGGVERYLIKAGLPRDQWDLFHQALLVREQYPLYLCEDEEDGIDDAIFALADKYEVGKIDLISIFKLFDALIEQWEDYRVKLQ